MKLHLLALCDYGLIRYQLDAKKEIEDLENQEIELQESQEKLSLKQSKMEEIKSNIRQLEERISFYDQKFAIVSDKKCCIHLEMMSEKFDNLREYLRESDASNSGNKIYEDAREKMINENYKVNLKKN